jgi:hypothetical protein
MKSMIRFLTRKEQRKRKLMFPLPKNNNDPIPLPLTYSFLSKEKGIALPQTIINKRHSPTPNHYQKPKKKLT